MSTQTTVPSSFVSGWWPPSTSMMLRRVAPIATSAAVVDVEAGVVRAAVPEQRQHRRRPALGVDTSRSRDAAHVSGVCSRATTKPAVTQTSGETA